jgi:uncharacterized protein
MIDHRRHQVIDDRARWHAKLKRECPGLPLGAAASNDSI